MLVGNAVGETKLNVTLVQALINAGVIPDPRIPQSSLQGQQWFQNGHIVLNSTTTSDFTAWYGGIEGHYDLAAKVRQYTQDMNSQQATSSDSP